MTDGGSFRESIRTSHVSYPVPFVFAATLAFAAFMIALGVLTNRSFSWVPLLFGGVAVLGAFALIGYATVFRPSLLRSERYELTARALDMLDDSELPENAQKTVETLVLGFEEPKTFIPSERDGDIGRDDSD